MTDVVESLLPLQSSAFQRAFEQATAVEPIVDAAIDTLRGVKQAELPAFLDFLIWEYGLYELRSFVPNPYDLLREGRAWQYEHGTFAAMARGLGWVGYAAQIEESPVTRRWWNSFQLGLTTLPAADSPDLARIDKIATLSAPFRSDFRRGFFGYDVRALIADRSRLDGAILDNDSGVRLRAGGPKWSFGRTREVNHTLTQSEGEGIGIWQDAPVGATRTWANAATTWAASGFAWTTSASVVRQREMTDDLLALPLLVAFKTSGGSVIGYRRPRVARGVLPETGGPYTMGSQSYGPSDDGTAAYIEAMTDFADSTGGAIASVGILVDAVTAPGVKPGKLWLTPSEVSGGSLIASASYSITMRPTVRDRVKFLVRF